MEEIQQLTKVLDADDTAGGKDVDGHNEDDKSADKPDNVRNTNTLNPIYLISNSELHIYCITLEYIMYRLL